MNALGQISAFKKKTKSSFVRKSAKSTLITRLKQQVRSLAQLPSFFYHPSIHSQPLGQFYNNIFLADNKQSN